MKRYNNFFNELWDLDHRLKPWQSIGITLVYIVFTVSMCIYLYFAR